MSGAEKAEQGGSLAGRAALISGGARGIGLAIGERFQHEGAQVFLLDCDNKAGSTAANDLSATSVKSRRIFACRPNL